MTKPPYPDGYHTVTPYLVIDEAANLISFLAEAFAAEELLRHTHDNGKIAHAAMRIGDSIIELADVPEHGQAMPTTLHIYLPDTDRAYHRALQAGATSVREPMETDYGERSAGIADPSGNHWYIATYHHEPGA